MKVAVDDKTDNLVQNKLMNTEMTKHFIERYHERVWDTPMPTSFYWKTMVESIHMDIENRLLTGEKNVLTMFIETGDLQLPFGKHYLLIIKSHTLVTVYN